MKSPASIDARQQPVPRFLSDRGICIIGSALIIVLAAAVHVWADLQWTVNFDGDGAIVGLMARHILQGQIPTYFYGQQYVGSLEALIAAGFMYLFGPSVFALRLSALFFFTGFLALQACFVYKHWGTRVTLISLLVLALPGWKMLEATFRPFGGYCTLLFFGTALLLLSEWQPSGMPTKLLRSILTGVVAGLGLWSQPMMLIYLASVILVLWLRTPEWDAIQLRLCMASLRLFHVSGGITLMALTLSLLGLLVTGFFSAGWSQAEAFVILQSMARWLLVVAIASVALLTVLESTRRRQLVGWATLVLAGLAIGTLPVWMTWLVSGIAPSTAIIPSSPADTLFRLHLTLTELLPSMLGISFRSEGLRFTTFSSVFWLLTSMLALGAFGVFILKERQTLQSILSLTPLGQRATPAALVGLLFGVSLVLVLLGGNTLDTDSVRYLLVAWQASSIILAIFFSRVVARFRIMGLLLVALWVFQVGVSNLVEVERLWNGLREGNAISATGVEFRPFTRESIAELETFLQERKVQGGYADYWVAYQLDFLSEEKLIVAPYNGIDRYPAYTARVDSLPVQAFILRPGLAPAGPSQSEDLVRSMSGSYDGGFAFSRITSGLEKMTATKRQRVGNWDVWLVSEPQIDAD